MEQIQFKVEGMTCGGCVKSIQNALSNRDGVVDTKADLESKTVSIEFDPAKIQKAGLAEAIEDAGFDVAA